MRALWELGVDLAVWGGLQRFGDGVSAAEVEYGTHSRKWQDHVNQPTKQEPIQGTHAEILRGSWEGVAAGLGVSRISCVCGCVMFVSRGSLVGHAEILPILQPYSRRSKLKSDGLLPSRG